MNKFKYLLTLAIVFVILPNFAYANCTEEETLDFKRNEKYYKVTYEYDKTSNDYIMRFNASKKEMFDFVFFDQKNLDCKEVSDGVDECYHMTPGTYQIGIFGMTSECNNLLKKISITLPKYNSFADDPICKGIEEFVLCQPDYDKEIDYDTFVSRVNTYKKTKQREENEEKENNSGNKILNDIASFLEDNLLTIALIIIFIIAIVITVILTAKSIRKSRRLE